MGETATELSHFLLTVGVLVGVSRVFGEFARYFKQPSLAGELLAGIVLGPTVLGYISPDTLKLLFPPLGAARHALDALVILSVTLFLMVSGMEIDLSSVFRQGRLTLLVATANMVFPFLLTFFVTWYAPGLMGFERETSLLIYALFLATALSISALPVISRVLMELDMLRSDMGVVALSSSALNDLCGWLVLGSIFATIGGPAVSRLPVLWVIGITIFFSVFMLTLGRKVADKLLVWLQAYTSWPGGVIGGCIILALLAGAFTEWLGIHAVLGSFLVGVAIGQSRHLRHQTRRVVSEFVSHFFAPIFFASIGLRINFITSFDFDVVFFILLVAILGKVVGVMLIARLAGLGWRESVGLGFVLDARGSMEIIMGTLALDYGFIHERTFEALIIMGIVTSILSSFAVKHLLIRKIQRGLADFLDPALFRSPLHATNPRDAIVELGTLVARSVRCEVNEVVEAVWRRETVMPTGMENGVAVPHARLEGLTKPVVAVGISPEGIDFDAPDGSRSNVIILFLTPPRDDGVQLELLADIARTFASSTVSSEAKQITSFTEFVALTKLGVDMGGILKAGKI